MQLKNGLLGSFFLLGITSACAAMYSPIPNRANLTVEVNEAGGQLKHCVFAACTVEAGPCGATRSITITNSSSVPALNIQVTSSSSFLSLFAITNQCPASLAPLAQCQIIFGFNEYQNIDPFEASIVGSNTNIASFFLRGIECI